METRKRGIRVILVAILVLLGISVLLEMGKSSPRDYTRAQFKQDIKDDLISEVEIIPNEQTPSGRLEIAFRDGSSKVLYVADVEEMEDLLEANDILVMRDNIPQDTWFKSIAMPILIAVSFRRSSPTSESRWLSLLCIMLCAALLRLIRFHVCHWYSGYSSRGKMWCTMSACSCLPFLRANWHS